MAKIRLITSVSQTQSAMLSRVHVFAQKDAAAICIAVGTHVAVENGKTAYSWQTRAFGLQEH
jgi:hypothetical protein